MLNILEATMLSPLEKAILVAVKDKFTSPQIAKILNLSTSYINYIRSNLLAQGVLKNGQRRTN